jgi:hypothetical protein
VTTDPAPDADVLLPMWRMCLSSSQRFPPQALLLLANGFNSGSVVISEFNTDGEELVWYEVLEIH